MNHTIAAIATAAAESPIGIIRISGKDAIGISAHVFEPCGNVRLQDMKSYELRLGSLYAKGGKMIDKPMAVVMRGPGSYTGEDVVELHCHGSLAILNAALGALFAAGAHPALPGEFTKRAFLNSKMDLTQVESVIDLITAKTAEAAQNAAGQLDGVIGRKLSKIYDGLIDTVSHFHAVIDYPDEDIPSYDLVQIKGSLSAAAEELNILSESYSRGRVLREGVKCAIIGRPNVGKSSILNALLGYDRAIVTSIPGTTRDTIEENAHIGGVLLKISDTAGIRDAEDPVEELGVSRALRAAQSSELVFIVVDGSRKLTPEDRTAMDAARGSNVIVIVNKSDLKQRVDMDAIEAAFLHVCQVCALTGDGIENIDSHVRRIFEMDAPVYDGEVLTNQRQASAVSAASESLLRAHAAIGDGMTPDAVLIDIEDAISRLSEVLGRAVTNDVISRIFERFCVGK